MSKGRPSERHDPSAAPTAKWELVTPEIAGDWLARNTHNRRLRDSRVRRYAADLLAGRWKVNGETIKFDSKGELADGQHRLAAIVFAGISVNMLIVRNVAQDAFDSIDIGIVRSLGDTLYISGEANPTPLAQAINTLYRYRNTGMFSVNPTAPATTQALEALLDAEPGIRHHVAPAHAVARKVRIGRGTAAVLRYLMAEIDEDQAIAFWNAVQSGAELTATSPIYRLRERLLGKTRIGQDETAALSIKAWNLYRSGQKIQVLVWRPAHDPMPVPA